MTTLEKTEKHKEYYAKNREHLCALKRRWYHSKSIEERRKNYSHNPQQKRAYQLKTAYGISLDQYDRLLTYQNNVCAICKGTTKRKLHVDHDHSCCPGTKSCGKCIRGLLCSRCNTGLGLFHDSKSLMSTASAYLATRIDLGLE